LGLGLAFGLAQAAGADEGVVEINQARALGGGVTPDDDPGFPVTLALPGTYRLTGDLVVPDENTTGIRIDASNVTVDLNGFSILGPVVCTAGATIVCTPSGGFGNGILQSFIDFDNATIRDGTIRGMGSTAIFVGGNARVERMRVIGNGSQGIVTANGFATIRDCTVLNNASAGINSGPSSLVEGNVANSNGLFGISAANATTVRGNTVNANRNKAIIANDATIIQNTIVGNQGDGIDADAGVIVGNTIKLNTGLGVRCGTADALNGCNVVDNLVNGNTLGGLGFNNLGGGAYSGNLINANPGGTVSGAATQTGGNVCDGDAVCP
jgi:hypothetical protein